MAGTPRKVSPSRYVLSFVFVTALASLGSTCSERRQEPVRPPDIVPPKTMEAADPVRPEPVTARPARGLTRQWPSDLTAIEDPTGVALDHFFDRLRRIDAGEAGLKARVIHYGDSHIAADVWTGHLRRKLQLRFGDGGHGFMLPGKPWRSYFHMDADNGTNNARYWTAERTRTAFRIEDGMAGLGGATVYTSKRGAKVWMATESDGPVGMTAGLFEVWYLRHPRGGKFNIRVDGKVVSRVNTRGKDIAPDWATVTAPDGPHTVEVDVTGGGEVRLFGIVMEREGTGVVYDSVGLNGARAHMPLTWDVEHWKGQLTKRDPDLLVTTYGTNEVDDNLDYDEYAEQFGRVLDAMREAAPEASCLVIGPPDRAWKVEGAAAELEAAEAARMRAAGDRDDTLWDTPQPLIDIVETQRSVALARGCAFWSSLDAMGGPGAIDLWARDDPPMATRDRIHLTRDGYAEMATRLFDSLMFAYDGGMTRQDAAP